jgi:phosphonoacetaldehyde hydrolase
MEFIYRRSYRGPVKAVVFDWGGTTVDHGCIAPAIVFVKVFKNNGVHVTLEQARGPMGLMKRDHIRVMAQMPAIAAQWQEAHGRPCTEADIEAMYQAFIPLQLDLLADYADPIPGVVDLAAALRQRGIKIGSSTGYNNEVTASLAREAARRGYAPDTWVSSTDVPAGRPFPWMMYENAARLGVYPPEAVVKIGDTVPDIDEGLNAGAWTVGVAQTGNELGLSASEVATLPLEELQTRLAVIRKRLAQAGAHFVVDVPWQIEDVIVEIGRLLAQGERP